jgi:hypothetical protein
VNVREEAVDETVPDIPSCQTAPAIWVNAGREMLVAKGTKLPFAVAQVTVSPLTVAGVTE